VQSKAIKKPNTEQRKNDMEELKKLLKLESLGLPLDQSLNADSGM